MESNFLKRAITGLLFVTLLVGSIASGPLAFIIVFALFSAFTTFELGKLLNQSGQVKINKFITALASFYLFIAMAAYTADVVLSKVFIPYVAILVYLFVSELYLKHKNPIGNLAAIALTQVYIGLNIGLINVLAFAYDTSSLTVSYEKILPLSLFVFIWISDSGAYLVGSSIGKNKLFPRISPNKSWEGSIGGGFFAIIAALIISYLDTNGLLQTWQWIGFALTVVLFGTWGDLIESLFKRQLGIKDSGTILPGHGGFLDRFDSTILAIPAVVLYLLIIRSF